MGDVMEQIALTKLVGIKPDFQPQIFEAMKTCNNIERLLVCLFFMSDLSDEDHSFDKIEENLKQIFPPSSHRNTSPADYTDFQATNVRGPITAETQKIKAGHLDSKARTWEQVSRGHWRNSEIGNQCALQILQDREIQIELSSTSMDSNPTNSKEPHFTSQTLQLLTALRQNPTKEYYQSRKDEFKTHLEEPFKQLFHTVAAMLPEEIKSVMETENRIFGRILKNDFGQGGAWDFFWGAFYPRGSNRTKDAQLSMWINCDWLEFGFFIGEYGNSSRERFLRNCQTHYQALEALLEPILSNERLYFGRQSNFEIGPSQTIRAKVELTWQAWLKNPDQGGYDVSYFIPKWEVTTYSQDELIKKILQTYRELFPLILLAIDNDPLPRIIDYFGLTEEEVEPDLQPIYPLADCAEVSGFELEVLERWKRAIERKGQAILYGPPGTGKTFLAEQLARHLIGGGDGFWELVQFHPAYNYEDFIQGIRPQADEEGRLTYQLEPGRFLQFCRRARTRQGICVLIVDEINRANLARVFGELMYLLEYRDKQIPLAGGNEFQIPNNVRLIGTMNTADRSIALVDHALRRRFAFLALEPNFEVLRRFHEREQTGFPILRLIELLREVNTQIADKHYEIGISYFLRTDLAGQLEDIWTMEIEPYLEEYFFDQPDTVTALRWNKIEAKVYASS